MPSITLAEIIAEFEELDDPADRLAYLVEIGKSLPPLDDAFRTEEHRVLGCQSMVWMVADERKGTPPTLSFTADSDAPMVRGLIAILLAAYSNHTPAEILAFPIEQLFERLKLLSFLTPMRSNGLFSMVKRIQNLARRAQAAGPQAGAPGSPLVQVRMQPRSELLPAAPRRTSPARPGL
ncbi:MAG TPA: SufE family protein, partial [Pirellulaceae bacterium]|nr:SufE family protein [Pirellulaceae bacterium]